MTTSISRTESPEDREIQKKRAELDQLESDLAERELELATVEADLQVFERRYLWIVGRKYAELDEWQARIAEALAARSPRDRAAAKRAQETRQKARTSAEESGYRSATGPTAGGGAPGEAEPIEPERFEPSEELKQLYRRLARLLHPDLARDDKEQSRRTRLMAEVNAAYRARDIDRLRDLLREAENAPEAVPHDAPGAELIRLIRQIDAVGKRLRELTVLVAEKRRSDLGQLLDRARGAETDGRDLLWHMAADVADTIVVARRDWVALNAQGDR